MGAEHFYSLDGPSEQMPDEHQMRIANLSSYTGLVRDMGADPRPFLERHEIDPRNLRDPDHTIECQKVVDLMEHTSERLKDPLFGLKLAQAQDADVFGAVTALCRAAPTVRDSVQCFIDYLPVVHAPTVLMELVESSETAELRWNVRTDLGCNKQAKYQAVLLDLKLLHLMGGKSFQPSYVNLAVDTRSREIAELESRIGCRFNKTAAQNAIGFPVATLDRAVPTASRMLYNLLRGYLDQFRDSRQESVADRVANFIRCALPTGGATIERCAEKMSVSVRTLQTQLGEAGLKFSDILEQQRMELARAYLQKPGMSLDDIADSLGYSEQSSFGRAFKRWMGMTPRQFRQGPATPR